MKNKRISQEESRQIMMNILSVVDKICEDNNIHYIMGGGTLLGAVRHKGFIPWDDDIDIFVPRKEYDKLLQILKRQEIVSWLEVIDENVEGYFYPFAKVVDNRTMIKSKSSVLKHGIWVDVFPMENVPDDDKIRQIFLNKCKYLRAFLISMVTDFSELKFGKKVLLKRILKIISACIGERNLLNYSMSFMRKYNDVETETMCITFSPYATEYVDKEMMNEIIELDFEDKKFKAPKAYDVLLRRTFGDYMQLPPENKRKNHEIVAWWIE